MKKFRVIVTEGVDQTKETEGEKKMEELKEEAQAMKKKMQKRSADETVAVIHDVHLGRLAAVSAVVGVATILTSTVVIVINKSITGGA